MGVPVMILGESGSGKSTSFRNLDPDKVMLFKVTNKPLPFKSKNWKAAVTHDWQRIISGIMKASDLGKKIVIIDDFQYLMAEEYLQRSDEKSFQKFTDIAVHAREVLRAAQNVAGNIRVYITWHTQTDDQGVTKAKTIGKFLDEKICIEGLFTIVLKTIKRDKEYLFQTQTNGFDVCKSPMGMFESDFIGNDLNIVDDAICDYYDIKETNKGAEK